MINDLIDEKVPVLLDPTLLLDETDYLKIASPNLNLPRKYIFYYSPGYNRNINKLVKKISKKYNLPVIAFNTKSFYAKGMNFSSFSLSEMENPATYLTLIKNATLIITTSFHGTIFSTIFRKKFWTVKNGGMFGTDDRVMTLMRNLDLKDRLVNIKFDEKFDYLKIKNYQNYEKKLKELKKISMEYLTKCLK